ncbi:transporter substrate-binding domain-containing protein [uncultured Desulfosarcina sp.]|uniref:substrate-binding periplasmic protein n=1 Tax=uncultured Desulfosarcina sp. TaxID=218289 RepID=UPI0029C6C289|nr:transporter substrate-binding domain-containing protein [uncultured Desulfosarcina sp.]
MKRIFLLLVLIVFQAHPVFSQDSMKFVYFENFAPYSWETDSQVRGFLIDVVNHIVRNKMGLPVSHAGYPWKRAQKMVEMNQADAFITVPTEQRRAYTVIGSEPVFIDEMTLFTHKDNRKVRNLKTGCTISDLKPLHLVDFIGNGWAERNLKGLDVFWVPTMDQALFLLFNNRYDVFIGGAKYVRYNIKRLGYEKTVVATPIVLDSIPFNLCIGKQSAFVSILQDFDKALKNLRRTGELEDIFAKYR